jgi:hypothetical protein
MDKVCFWCWRKRRIVCEGKKKETSGSALSLSPLALSGSHARRGWLCGIGIRSRPEWLPRGSHERSGPHAVAEELIPTVWVVTCVAVYIHPRLVFGCFLFIYLLSEPMESSVLFVVDFNKNYMKSLTYHQFCWSDDKKIREFHEIWQVTVSWNCVLRLVLRSDWLKATVTKLKFCHFKFWPPIQNLDQILTI